jgi:co-chaperonin GroES (HSP10)
MSNASGWSPAGRAVLVLPDEIAEKSSTIVIPKTVTDRTKLMQDRATIVEIGPMCWAEEETPRAKVGDKVILAAFSGYILEGDDGKEYRFVNERDIFAIKCGA